MGSHIRTTLSSILLILPRTTDLQYKRAAHTTRKVAAGHLGDAPALETHNYSVDE